MTLFYFDIFIFSPKKNATGLYKRNKESTESIFFDNTYYYALAQYSL